MYVSCEAKVENCLQEDSTCQDNGERGAFQVNFAEYRRKFGKPSSTLNISSSIQRLGYMTVTLICKPKEHVFQEFFQVF